MQDTVFFSSCLAVFQGGGCRGAAHAGAYQAAADRGVRFSRVAGTSAGSIVAALIGAGGTPEQVLAEVAGLDFMKFMVKPDLPDYKASKVDRFIKGPFLKMAGQPVVANVLTMGGQYSSSYIEQWMNQRLRHLLRHSDDIIRFKHLKIPTYVIATDLEGVRARVWSKESTPEDSIAFAVRASCSIPGFFQPVAQGTNRFVDGGVLSNLPTFVFKDESSVWRLQPERILAFRLKAAYQDAVGWSAERLLSSLVNAAIEGATELQTSLQSNVHVITIPTEDIVATDFEKMSQKDAQGRRVNVERLIGWGRKATHDFINDEFNQVTEAAPPVQVLLDRFEVYQAGVAHASRKTEELIIASEYTRWLWDLFPTLFQLKRSGTQIHVIVTPPSGDKIAKDLEANRRKLLTELGIRVVEQPDIPFTGYLFDGAHATDARAMIYTHRDQVVSDVAVSLWAPNHRDLIQALWSRLEPWIDPTDPVLTYQPALSVCDPEALFQKLRTVWQYTGDKLSVELAEIPIAGLNVLSPSIRQYKLKQVPWIDGWYTKTALEPYLPMKVTLKSGQFSIVTPPVVEKHASKYYVIDGKTRAYEYLCQQKEMLKCVLIEHANPNLPGAPIPLSEMTIVNRESPEKRFPSDRFRNIEQAVHSW